MLKLWSKNFFVPLLPLFCAHLYAQEDKFVGFSADFLALVAQQQEPNTKTRIQCLAEKEKKPASAWTAVDTVEASITPAAAVYTLIKIVALYRTVYSGTSTEHVVDNSWLMELQQRIVSLVYPTSLHNNARFILGSGRIIIEVLIYKTLAQMLVLCLKGNIFDAIEQSAARIVSLAKRIIGFG